MQRRVIGAHQLLLVAAGAMLILWIIGGSVQLALGNGHSCEVRIVYGTLHVAWGTWNTGLFFKGECAKGLVVWCNPYDLELALPGLERTSQLTHVYVPLWMFCVIFAAGGLVLRWRAGRREAGVRKACKCGYDLTGNVSGRCPECGARIDFHRVGGWSR